MVKVGGMWTRKEKLKQQPLWIQEEASGHHLLIHGKLEWMWTRNVLVHFRRSDDTPKCDFDRIWLNSDLLILDHNCRSGHRFFPFKLPLLVCRTAILTFATCQLFSNCWWSLNRRHQLHGVNPQIASRENNNYSGHLFYARTMDWRGSTTIEWSLVLL